MKKRMLSLLCVLALCLGLLPVTALAAGPNTVYVGGVELVGSSDKIVYATTNENGEVITEGATADNYNIKWDGSTLTLHGATIKKELYASDPPLNKITGAAIGVINQNGNAELTIQLESSNTIEGVSYGIYVYAPSIGSANLTITGGGTLVVNSNFNPIYVISSNGNAALGIKNAKVTATSSYGNGVTVRSGNSENSSASLTVNGGSLTATASSENVSGISLRGTGETGGSSSTVTVSNNAIVRANGSAGGITSDSSTGVQYGTGSSTTGGIVWNGSNGTVYGNVTLQEDLEIGEGESLTIGDGASLIVPEDKTITVESGGKLDGTPTGSGTVKIAPTITTESLPDGEVGAVYSQTLTATGDPTITWSVTSGTLPAGLTLSEDGTISGTPTTAGQSDFTVKATNSAGDASKQLSLTINSVPVTGISLNAEALELYTGETATLTAMVTPENATNKAVTWESSNTEVATVDNNGKVTALKPGTATITATAGSVTAECTVTVSRKPVIPDPNGITVTQPANGTIRVNPSNGSVGTLITVTATPDEGYELAYITVDGEKITGNTFRMPDHDVTVSAVFVPVSFPFTDVKSGDWFYDYVAYVYTNGLMDGTSATTFEPNANMTRAMVWAILARIDGEEITGSSWATDARAWAMAEGVSDGTDPNGLVTREQFATMLYRYAVAKGYDVSIGESTNILSYADFASISEYAVPAMQWACGSGMITGVTDSTLEPAGTATRAQCAAMLMRFVEP